MGALVAQPQAVSDDSLEQEDAKERLKVLHEVVTGEWFGPDEQQSPEDAALLLAHSDSLAGLLVQCVERAFDRPAIVLNSRVPGTFLGVDLSLLNVSLACLFAMVRRKDLADSLNADTLFVVFHQCLLRLCDPKVRRPLTADPDSLAHARMLETALTMILIDLAKHAETSSVLSTLVRVMFLCIPSVTSDLGASIAAVGFVDSLRYALPSAATRPTSKLVIKVLTDETDLDEPHAGQAYDTRAVLRAIHQFFAHHPANTTDDKPFRTVKTILNELIKARGGRAVLAALQGCADIPSSSFVYLLTARLGDVPTPQGPEQRVAALVNRIPEARDRDSLIRELHGVLCAHPSVDVHQQLGGISSAFRRHVLDQLAKLDGDGDEEEDEAAPTDENAAQPQSNYGAPPSVRAHKEPRDEPSSTPEASPAPAVKSHAVEAMRFLDAAGSFDSPR